MLSVLWIHRIQGFNGVSGSRSRRAKWPTDKKKLINFIFWSAGCSLLRPEGFSCSLRVLYGGRGISKYKFLINKKISVVFISSVIWSSKPWIQILIRIHLKCWIRIRIRIRIQRIRIHSSVLNNTYSTFRCGRGYFEKRDRRTEKDPRVRKIWSRIVQRGIFFKYCIKHCSICRPTV